MPEKLRLDETEFQAMLCKLLFLPLLLHITDGLLIPVDLQKAFA